MLAKLEEIHHAYKKAKLKVHELAQEREGLERDKVELAEKFAEKCRWAPGLTPHPATHAYFHIVVGSLLQHLRGSKCSIPLGPSRYLQAEHDLRYSHPVGEQRGCDWRRGAVAGRRGSWRRCLMLSSMKTMSSSLGGAGCPPRAPQQALAVAAPAAKLAVRPSGNGPHRCVPTCTLAVHLHRARLI
jgi:hypothetical protein